MLIDSHAHLNFPDYSDKLDKIISRANEARLEKIVNIGTSLNDSRSGIELAQKYDNLYATVGIHPNDNPEATAESINWQEFERLVELPKVVGIGECGLDYSRISYDVLSIAEVNLEKERQRKLFAKQIEIAQKLNLPLSIHIRDAQNDLLQLRPVGEAEERKTSSEVLFSETLSTARGVFHCFSGNQEYLNFIVNKLPSFYISFAGNLTFKNAHNLRDLAKLVPVDRLLVETDCPFLSPEPFRGGQNEPARVKYVAEKLAEIKNLDFVQIAQATTKNANILFDL